MYLGMKYKLDRWALLGNTLVGYGYDIPGVPPRARVFTDVIISMNMSTREAITKSKKDPTKILKWFLMEKGAPSEHVGNPEMFQCQDPEAPWVQIIPNDEQSKLQFVIEGAQIVCPG